jgi:hypothetical protein
MNSIHKENRVPARRKSMRKIKEVLRLRLSWAWVAITNISL